MRTQPKQVKETHAAMLSALLTLLIVFVYVLTTTYGESRGEETSVTEMPSPFEVVKEGAQSLLEKVKGGNTFRVENPQK